MYKLDLAFDNLQGLICHKTQPIWLLYCNQLCLHLLYLKCFWFLSVMALTVCAENLYLY